MFTNSLSATLLPREEISLDLDVLAKSISALVPDLDEVTVTKGEGDHKDTTTLRLDDIEVLLSNVAEPVRPSKFYALKTPYNAWIPQALIDQHQSHLYIVSGGDGAGLKNMETYAAAVHVVATAVCDCVDIGAVFWDSAELFVKPEEFAASVEPLMEGKMPVACWIGFHPIKPDEFALNSAVGMITQGLRHFIGREIELAPSPTDLDHAHMTLGSVVQRLMDHHLRLNDGETIKDLEMALSATIRTRDRWIRRDQAAFVLVTDDSVIDQSTLRPDRRKRGAQRQNPAA